MPSISADRLTLLAAALLVAGGLSLPAGALATGGHQPHDFTKIGCTYCHLARTKRAGQPGPRVFRRDISSLCSSCHEDSRANRINHRVGVIPSMKVPEDLHLGGRGELTCITCHMPHLPPVDKKSGTPTYFLRRSIKAGELCRACHPEGKYREPVSALRIVSPPDKVRTASASLPLIGSVTDDAVTEVSLSVGGAATRVPVRKREFQATLALKPGSNQIKVEAPKVAPITLGVTLVDAAEVDGQPLFRTHGAVTKGDCGGCHGARKPGEARQLDTVICSRCHEPKDALRYRHAPVAAGSCTVCHDPHGQDNRFLLRESPEKLCLTCHPGQMVIQHLLDKAVGADPAAVRRQGCGHCHDPHQSARKYLLRGE